jgi:hypothetical protein
MEERMAGKVINVVVNMYSPIQNGPAKHGRVIGYAGEGLRLQVITENPESPHDNWYLIVGPMPNPINAAGSWMGSGAAGWIECPHVSLVNWDGRIFVLKIPSDPDLPPTITETT